jgi:pimeloyl-ACP methyl ester carboxylesterase
MQTVQSKDGTTIAYDTLGSGPTLIYITGATCFRTFEPVAYDAQTFAQYFTVINYDRRGRSDSSNTLPYAIEREIEDIDALIDAARGSAYLYGHSSGAVLALEAALRLGDKVQKLVVNDASYVQDEAEQQLYAELTAGLNMLLDEGHYEEALTGFLHGIEMPNEAIDWMRQSPQWATMTALAPMLAYDMLLTSAPPPLGRLAALHTPTCVLYGENSPASIHAVAGQLCATLPNATCQQLAGQDHMPSPQVVLEYLTAFLHPETAPQQ